MGQLFQQNIPNITKTSSSLIGLAATNAGQPVSIQVGGQAYTPSTALVLNTASDLDTGSIAANSTYYVYAVISGGNLALKASLAAPAAGPTGFPQWAAIGLFKTLPASTSVDYVAGINPTEPGVTADGANVFTGATTFTQPLTGFASNNDYRNLIINGNFDFWQRGTSVSVGSSTNQFQADRFLVRRDFGNAPTYSRSPNVPTLAQSGFRSTYSLLLTNNATGTAPTGTQSLSVKSHFEGLDYAVIHGKKVRLQFWVKSSVSGTYSIAITAVTNRCYITTYSIAAANTWEKKFIDITMDNVDSNFAFDNTYAMSIWWSLSTGATRQTSSLNTWGDTFFSGSTTDTNTWSSTNSSTFQLAQVSLIPGDFASTADISFNRAGRTISDELSMCQRYYEKSYDVDVVPGTSTPTGMAQLGVINTTEAGIMASYKVTKRTTPVVSVYGRTGAPNTTGTENTSADLAVTVSGVSVGGTSQVGVLSLSAGTFTLGDFPKVSWAADAEL